MKNNKYNEFLDLLEKEDKGKSLLFILDLLNSGVDVVTVYEDYLIPSLFDFKCLAVEQEICIWKEHTRTSIIRTVLEASYPYIIEQRKKEIHKKVIVLCPQEEYHEIGAIIASNYFYLLGFESLYIGANTPSDDIVSAIKILEPDYVALSVSNYYNLVVTRKLTKKIRENYPNLSIILGGQAFSKAESLEQVTYNFYLKDYKDMVSFANEVRK
ncbi:MAG: cobalamin-dependent protein [Tenericutes bacterium]|nr:cobalamin-dependent protein [Mycoplasmatota bacterium]